MKDVSILKFVTWGMGQFGDWLEISDPCTTIFQPKMTFKIFWTHFLITIHISYNVNDPFKIFEKKCFLSVKFARDFDWILDSRKIKADGATWIPIKIIFKWSKANLDPWFPEIWNNILILSKIELIPNLNELMNWILNA